MYVNLASLTKQHRANQIITDIGTNGVLNFYTGSYPAAPDLAPAGTLLATLPLSTTAATATLGVQSGFVTYGGRGGTDGVYTLSITGGGGDGATGTFIVQGGILYTIVISNNGYGYTSPPILGGFTLAGLTGALATAVMTGVMIFNPFSSGSGIATGVASFARVATSGGIGIIDLNVGTTNAFSVVMNNTFISYGGTVTCSVGFLIES